MAEITLTAEQAAIYRQANEPVKVRDTDGIVLGTLDPGLTPEYIAELKRRAALPGPWYSGGHVQRMLRFLEDAWQREGKFDEKRMHTLIAEFEAQDHE
jgi:hypothetical protein